MIQTNAHPVHRARRPDRLTSQMLPTLDEVKLRLDQRDTERYYEAIKRGYLVYSHRESKDLNEAWRLICADLPVPCVIAKEGWLVDDGQFISRGFWLRYWFQPVIALPPDWTEMPGMSNPVWEYVQRQLAEIGGGERPTCYPQWGCVRRVPRETLGRIAVAIMADGGWDFIDPEHRPAPDRATWYRQLLQSLPTMEPDGDVQDPQPAELVGV